MKLIKDKKFLHNIAQFIDLTNTVGGGVSQAQVKMEQRKGGALLRIKLPGISPDQWQAVVDKNNLTVMALHRNEGHSGMQIPLFVQNFVLPQHADLANVNAHISGQELRVAIPFLPEGPRLLAIGGLE